MILQTIMGWQVTVDKERTQSSYTLIDKGGCEKCGCSACRNFSLVVQEALPSEILNFIRDSGIDIRKDAEVYSLGNRNGKFVHYAGEYYLWGSVIKAPALTNQVLGIPHITFVKPTTLAQKIFQQDGAIGIYFEALLPWKLAEPIIG